MNQEISGELVNTRCPEIIKILSLGRRTGRLYLNNGAETGNIFFQEGAIIHASCGSLEGEKAVYEAAVWTAGEYRFFMDDTPDVITVQKDVDGILTESTTRMRQMDRITALIPSSSMIYALDPDIKDKDLSIKSIQWRVIAHIDGRSSIAEIAPLVGLGVSDTMKVFYTLLRLGLLREADLQVSDNTRHSIQLPETAFVKALTRDLTRAVGPIAPFIIDETARDMGLDLLSDDLDQRAALIETLSSKIPDETMALNFLNTMTDWLRTGGEGL